MRELGSPFWGRLRHQVQDDFGVDRGLEDGAFLLEFVPELAGVGEIAVVGDGDLAAGAIDDQRLGVLEDRRSGGGMGAPMAM